LDSAITERLVHKSLRLVVDTGLGVVDDGGEFGGMAGGNEDFGLGRSPTFIRAGVSPWKKRRIFDVGAENTILFEVLK